MRRLRNAVIGMTLAVAVALPGTVAPVPARADNTQVQVDVATVIAVAKGLIDLWKSFQGGGMSIETATRQILAAIESAKTDIIAHIDRIAAAEARSCATRHVIELADIERFSPDTLQAWAQNATACVTLIDSLIDAVADKAASDTLGMALDVVGPIALIARSRAGFSTTGLTAVLIRGNNKVLSVLMPECHFAPGWNPPYISRSVCIAYNGDRADCSECPPPNDAMRAQAARRTSWVVAAHVLPALQS